MKIKCPACSKVLSVPEAAHGKVVKCPCGKQIRVPAGKTAAPAAAANRGTPPVATRPSAPTQPVTRPAPERVDSSIFDDMTEMDLQPVRAVNRPGQVAPVASGASAALAKASGEMQKEKQVGGTRPAGGPMKTGAIICFVIAALATIVGVNNVVGGANRPEETANLVAYAVGSLILPIAFLIGGLVLFGKSKKRRNAEST